MRQVAFHRPSIGPEEEREVLDTLRSGWITTGPKAKRFEKEFAAYVGAKNALAVAHCTGALHLALWSLGIGPGDEVIVPPYTFVATVNAVLMHHALPVFVDTDPETFQIDARKLEAAITERTACIMPLIHGLRWGLVKAMPRSRSRPSNLIAKAISRATRGLNTTADELGWISPRLPENVLGPKNSQNARFQLKFA
jgi:hypothetical protein